MPASVTTAPQRITLAAFGIQFIRQVLTPARVAGQMARQLPKPISGVAPLSEAGIGTASYTATVLAPSVVAANQIGQLRITLPIEVTVTLKLVVSKTFRLRAYVPFWLSVETYKPLVIFLNVSDVNQNEVNVVPLDPVDGIISGKIWEVLSAQMKVMMAQEVTKALRESYSSRIIDLLKTGPGMQAAFLNEAAALWTSPAGVADEPAPAAGAVALPAGETAEAPGEISWLDSFRPAGADFTAQAAERVSYEYFGGALLYFLASPTVVAKELNAAMQKSPLPPQLSNDVFAWSIAVPILGKASVQYLGQNADEQGLKAVLRLSMVVSVYVLHVWREGWNVEIEVPVMLPVRVYDGPLLVFLAALPVSPQDIVLAPQQTTNTGVVWGSVESKLREEITKSVNAALAQSGKDRTKVIEEEVRKTLKE